MNKRGSIIFGIIIAIMIFMAGLTMLNFVKNDVDTARDPSALDCANTSISDGTKLTCLGADATIPIGFIFILSAAGGVIATKFV